MTEFQSRTVVIGDDEEIKIGRFRGLKALEVVAIITDIVQNVPEVTDKANKFVKDFEANNSVILTPAMTRLPRYREIGLEPEDIAREPGGTLTIPQPPTVQQQLIHIMPDLFQVARKQATKLVGIVALPNTELERADDDDRVGEAIYDYGRSIVRRAYADQLADLLVTSWRVITEQFADREDLWEALGELPLLRDLLSTARNQKSPGSPQEVEVEAASVETPEMSKDESLISSTDSQVPTDGTAEPLSTASPGVS